MISYKKIIISAVQIVLNNKYLWFFGLFAAFISSSIYGKIYGNETSLAESWGKIKETGVFDFSVFSRMAGLAWQDPSGLAWRLLILLTVLVLGVFIFWLAVVSQGALINSAAKLYISKKTDFKEGLDEGKIHFWPVCFLKILEKVIIFFLFALLSIPWLLSWYYSFNNSLRISYYIITVLVLAASILVILITKYSLFYNVIKGFRFIDAIKSGLALLKSRLWISLEAGIVILIINFILSFSILMLISAIAIPFVFLMFLFYKLAFVAGLTFVLMLGMLILFIAVAVAGGILSSLNEVFWTIFFIVLIKGNPKSFAGSLVVKKS